MNGVLMPSEHVNLISAIQPFLKPKAQSFIKTFMDIANKVTGTEAAAAGGDTRSIVNRVSEMLAEEMKTGFFLFLILILMLISDNA